MQTSCNCGLGGRKEKEEEAAVVVVVEEEEQGTETRALQLSRVSFC